MNEPRITPDEREAIIELWKIATPVPVIVRQLRLPQATVLRVIDEQKKDEN